MMTVNVSVLDSVGKDLSSLSEGNQLADMLLRTITEGLYGQMSLRIFDEDGTKRSDGTLIGAYNPRYFKQRAKPPIKRTNTNVSLMATDQMHASFGWSALSDGSYGIGFDNKLAADKSKWNEDRFGEIFSLSESEKESIQPIISEFMTNHFGK